MNAHNHFIISVFLSYFKKKLEWFFETWSIFIAVFIHNQFNLIATQIELSKVMSRSIKRPTKLIQTFYRSSHQRCSMTESVFRNFRKFMRKDLSQNLFFNKVAGLNFIKKETLAQVFSCEFCEVFKSTFFTKNLWTTASVFILLSNVSRILIGTNWNWYQCAKFR